MVGIISGYVSLFKPYMYYISDRLAAKLARKDSLALKLSQRPQRQELIERNILHMVTSNKYFCSYFTSGMTIIKYVVI